MLRSSDTDLSTELYAQAFLIRGVEQRLLELFSEGKLFGTVHTCIGQEWTGISIAAALLKGDLIFSNHRCHGHFLAWTGNVEGLVAEVMGKQTGVCGGRGGSQHLCCNGFFSNGVLGGTVPVAAGLAFAQKLKQDGKIVVAFIGDGTLGEGVLYETLNITSKWELPLLVVLENNLYAQSTPQAQTLAGGIRDRAAAFGIKNSQTDTWHLRQLMSIGADCVSYVREQGQPCFLQIDTYRLSAHSKSDDDRAVEETARYWAIDPLTTFSQNHVARATEIQAEIKTQIEEAVARAKAAPYATLENSETRDQPDRSVAWIPTRMDTSERVVHRIHASLRRNMERDERIILIGEDIAAPYGGAFKVTGNLSELFPDRVRNTPVSEAAIIGLGNGLALAGRLPVCELMFGDFLTLAADQWINHAAKFRYMYNGQVRVPLIVRTPVGGKRGYGPTHSQSLEKHFMGLPDTTMLAVHNRYDPGLIYDELFSSIDRPTLVIENKRLYGARVSDELPAGFTLEHTTERYPTTRLRPEGTSDVTILCYGGMLTDVERAVVTLFDEHEIACEVVCPIQLYPLDLRPLADSVRQSGRLLIVEEGIGFAAFGAEAVAQLVESSAGVLKAVRRLSSPPHPIPSCGHLEKQLLPGADHVVRGVVELACHE